MDKSFTGARIQLARASGIYLQNSNEVKRENFNGDEGESVKDVLALADNCSLEGNRPWNPEAWDEHRRYEYFVENLALGGGHENPYYLLDVSSTIEVTIGWIEQLKDAEADEDIIKEFESQVEDLTYYKERFGNFWLNDGGSRCRTTIGTISKEGYQDIDAGNLSFPMPSPSGIQSMQYLDEDGNLRFEAIVSPDGKQKLHFLQLSESFRTWFLNLPVEIIILKNMLFGNAMSFFSRINKNYQMTDWVLKWSIGMSKARRLVKDHIDNDPFMRNEKKDGLFDLINIGPMKDYDEVYFGHYRLLIETIALYKYHTGAPNSFDGDKELIFGLLDAGTSVSDSDFKEIKENLMALYECITSNKDFEKTDIVDFRDVMSILRAISTKGHPVRRMTDAWRDFGNYRIKDNKARVAITNKILRLIKMMKEEDLYLMEDGKIATTPCSRDRARISPFTMMRTYKERDMYGDMVTNRALESYQQRIEVGEDFLRVPVDNVICYSQHRRDSNNLHLREEQILYRLQEDAEDFIQKGYLVPKRTTPTKEIADQKAMSNNMIVGGQKVRSLKDVEGGHIKPFSDDYDDSPENIEPEMKKSNRKRSNKVFA